MVDAEALNPITGIFIELMTNFLLANAPEQYRDGQRLGPYPVLFVLDEMPKMQKLQAVIQGPDLGRGQQVSYLIIGQTCTRFKKNMVRTRPRQLYQPPRPRLFCVKTIRILQNAFPI